MRIRMAGLLGGVLLLAGMPATLPAQQRDSERAAHLLSRATWGVTQAELARAMALGPEAWLERQLGPDTVADAEAERRLAPLTTLRLGMPELAEYVPPQQAATRLLATRGVRGPLTAEEQRSLLTAEERALLESRSPQRLQLELQSGRVLRAVYTERQLEDVLTDFWFNHFSVFLGKGAVRYAVLDYEATAIRPHVFGRFEEMLRATARHPAMLFYLDNWQSVAPDARAAALRPNAPARGLNENYARELLELHTLGVDGGYTEEDVRAVARAFTGWTFVPFQPARPAAAPARPLLRAQAMPEPFTFVFRAELHDRGEKHVLGHRLPPGRGIEDGEEVLRLLARHPATARHIAWKLVERFVSDEPDPDFVAELAEVFLRTEGDLRAVTRALFTSERFYAEAHVGSKTKTPFELVVSALRATGAEAGVSRQLLATLRQFGHLPYMAAEPTGYPAQSEDWVNAGAMLARMNFGLALAAGRIDGVRVPALPGARPDGRGGALGALRDPVPAMLTSLMPGVETAALEAAIREDLEANVASGTGRERLVRALGLAIGSPAFQRR